MTTKGPLLQFVSLLTFSLFLFTGCQKEIKNPTGEGTFGGVNDNVTVTGGITGNVVDENNRPVKGATVTSGGNTTITDRYGAFRFSNINISKANGTVKVVMAGYFNAYRTFPAKTGVNHNVRIKLIPKTNSGNFSGTTGGTINLAGGVKLVMPADAVSTASGTAYSGQVNVAMAWLDPASDDLPYTMMGDLRGLTTANEEMGLSTYGMIGVELTDAGGQPLKIASGKKAELTFPIPVALQGGAPATIDLWHFDEATARWKQEGTASKTGSNYVANVTHFSFWNCDVPFPLIDLCMSFKDQAGNPLINLQVRIKRLVNNTYGYGRTDSAGNLCGKVPKNEALVLEVLDICNTVVYSQNIGPFSSNTTLPQVTVNMPGGNLIISGTVTNCTGGNVTNGAAVVYISGGNHYIVTGSNGTFTLSIPVCSGTTINFSVVGIDYTTLQQSVPAGGTGTTGIVNVGTVQACGNAVEFLEVLINGEPFSYIDPVYNVFSLDSVISGPYQYRRIVRATKQVNGVINGANFEFLNNRVAGTCPLTWFFKYNYNSGGQAIVTPNPTVDITFFDPLPNGFVEGNFSVQVNFGGIIKNVVCTFRVRQ